MTNKKNWKREVFKGSFKLKEREEATKPSEP